MFLVAYFSLVGSKLFTQDKAMIAAEGNFLPWGCHQLGAASPTREVLFRPRPTSHIEVALSVVLKESANYMSCSRQCVCVCVALSLLIAAFGS